MDDFPEQAMDNQSISRRKSSKIKDCVASVESEALHQTKSSGKNLGLGHSHDQYHLLDMPNSYSTFYSLVASMPVPEPIWSTTEPCVLASNNSFSFDELVVEDQNQASSSAYTWWLGFLNSLDGKNVTTNCEECFEKYPKEYGCDLRQEDSYLVGVTGGCESCDKSVLGTTDQWLSFPSSPEDEVETTMFL